MTDPKDLDTAEINLPPLDIAARRPVPVPALVEVDGELRKFVSGEVSLRAVKG